MKVKVIILFVVCILSLFFLIVSRKLGLSWAEILGIFIGVGGLLLSVWMALKSISDAEQNSISEVKKDLIILIENIKRDKEETDRSQDKDLDLIKQQTALLSNVFVEQSRINAEMSGIFRDIEQLSAALAQNSKYAEALKRVENVEKRVDKLESRV
jgi:hypothetical protein